MRFIAAFAVVLVSCAGCGQRLPVAPVSGTITLDGQPLADAHITTQPIATDSRNPGPGSFGRTDAEGHFELELVNPPMKGAIIGEHRVMILPAAGEPEVNEPHQTTDGKQYWTDEPQEGASSDQSPQSFGDGSLRMQVAAEGTRDLRFDLKRSR
jgi:hypothetical protein